MREREVETDLPIYAIPAGIKKAGEPYIYEGTLQKYLTRFEFHYHNGSTTHTFKLPSVERRDGKTYMIFKAAFNQQFTVFFDNHDCHLAMGDKY